MLVETIAYKSMICRPRPIFNSVHQAVLDRIVVNIVDVLVQILLVPYLMFPETPLPYAAFSLSPARKALNRLTSAGFEISTGESSFD